MASVEPEGVEFEVPRVETPNAVICLLWSMSRAQFHKVQSSVRDYSHSIQRILMK